MTAAGVQNIEPSAYFPPASTSSSDAKGAPAADSRPDKPRDFQSELARQDTGLKETKSPGHIQMGSTKAGSGKSGKKQDAPTDGQNPSAPLSIQAAESPKEILPLVMALPKQDEGAKADDEAGEATRQNEPTQALPRLGLPNQLPAANAAPTATPDSAQDPILPLAAALAEPEASKPEDQSATSDKRGASDSERMSRAELKLADATPPEPVATAIEETKDSGQSSPSALAFAARMTAVPQKADDSIPGNPSETQSAPGSRAPGRTPIRYVATAQILPNDAERLTKDIDAAAAREPQTSPRTDMFVPRIENAREAASSSGPATPQQAAPPARTERIIEPPAAPPTSAHDIRVRVPDNNGGSTQVRFVESGGEVRVSVRTADEGLAQNLRTHLNDLTQRLADGGMPAEFWKPAPSAASSQNNHSQPDDSHSDRQGRGSGGQHPGQDAQRDQQQERPAWLEEMEASLHGSELKR